MYRYSVTGYDNPGTLQSKSATVDSDEATLSSSRSVTLVDRPAFVDIDGKFSTDAISFMNASPDYLAPSFRRYGLSRYSVYGSLQSKPATVDCDEATVSQTRTITLEDRPAAVDIPSEFTLGSVSYMVASPDYLMPSFRRFGMSRFSVLGTLQTRDNAVTVTYPGTLGAARNASTFANRPAAVNSTGGYAEGMSYAVPDVTGLISVAFEEVYDI